MNTKKYNWILYLISGTILATIAIQFYWNYKNYEQNKQYVLNEIQNSLNDAVNQYYTNLTKNNFLTIVEPDSLTQQNQKQKRKALKNIFKNNNNRPKNIEKHYSEISEIEIRTDSKKEFNHVDSIFIDSIFVNSEKKIAKETGRIQVVSKILQLSKDGKKGVHIQKPNTINQVQVFRGKKARDSLKLINGLKTMYIAIHNDSLAYTDLDSLLSKELKSKKINIQYAFQHYKKDTLYYNYNLNNSIKKTLFTKAKSTYFHHNDYLKMEYTNPTKEALKRSSTGILLSLLLSLAVITSLFYLLKIINKQKELAEIKNDLISNITHEFKTPITTVSTAIEAIDNFNMIDDKEKTKKYLSISSIQLKKLHQMVEKLLETATLDGENLMLKKELIDLISLTDKIVQKHQLIAPEKHVQFSTNISEITTEVDIFHFENSISNLIDNAIKYGGDVIEVNINAVLNTIEISVADNGIGINRNQQEKIFDKFYRVPKGNTHDVKGFGIGLYYTKKIVEKHNGFISLTSTPKQTVFKITLPND